jgi:hypothetical protein
MSKIAEQIAVGINAHFKKFESRREQGGKYKHFWGSGAHAVGGKVLVCYVSYQGSTRLSIETARAYLAWLDAGNVGQHYQLEHQGPRLDEKNLCRFPDPNSRPIFEDHLHLSYKAVAAAYFAALETFFPALDRTRKLSRYNESIETIPNLKDFYPCGVFHTYHALTPAQQEVATKLYVAIGDALDVAFQRGLDYGRNLLVQMAKGEITSDTFERPFQKEDHR